MMLDLGTDGGKKPSSVFQLAASLQTDVMIQRSVLIPSL